MRLERRIVVVVVLVVWGLITHGTFAGSGDEPHYAIIAHSIAFDGDLDVANNYAGATIIGGGTLQPEMHALLRGGRLRPVHDVGMPLLFAPVVRLAYGTARWLADVVPAETLRRARLTPSLLFRHQISLVMALLAGLLARELFLAFAAIGGSRRRAFWWALLFVLSPPLLAHSFLFFTELPSALVAIAVFRQLTLKPGRDDTAALALGVLTGLLFLIHVRNIGLVAGLVAVAAMHVRDGTLSRPALQRFGAGILAMVAVRTIVTYDLWGTLLTTPHAALAATAAGAIPGVVVTRLAGLLLDREYGLLAFAPIYLLVAAGVWSARSAEPRALRDSAVVVALYLLPILLPFTNVHGWTGGWSPAARLLVPIVPLLALTAYAYVKQASNMVVMALLVLQLGIDAYVWQFPKTLWNEGNGAATLRVSAWLPSLATSGTRPSSAP